MTNMRSPGKNLIDEMFSDVLERIQNQESEIRSLDNLLDVLDLYDYEDEIISIDTAKLILSTCIPEYDVSSSFTAGELRKFLHDDRAKAFFLMLGLTQDLPLDIQIMMLESSQFSKIFVASPAASYEAYLLHLKRFLRLGHHKDFTQRTVETALRFLLSPESPSVERDRAVGIILKSSNVSLLEKLLAIHNSDEVIAKALGRVYELGAIKSALRVFENYNVSTKMLTETWRDLAGLGLDISDENLHTLSRNTAFRKDCSDEFLLEIYDMFLAGDITKYDNKLHELISNTTPLDERVDETLDALLTLAKNKPSSYRFIHLSLSLLLDKNIQKSKVERFLIENEPLHEIAVRLYSISEKTSLTLLEISGIQSITPPALTNLIDSQSRRPDSLERTALIFKALKMIVEHGSDVGPVIEKFQLESIIEVGLSNFVDEEILKSLPLHYLIKMLEIAEHKNSLTVSESVSRILSDSSTGTESHLNGLNREVEAALRLLALDEGVLHKLLRDKRTSISTWVADSLEHIPAHIVEIFLEEYVRGDHKYDSARETAQTLIRRVFEGRTGLTDRIYSFTYEIAKRESLPFLEFFITSSNSIELLNLYIDRCFTEKRFNAISVQVVGKLQKLGESDAFIKFFTSRKDLNLSEDVQVKLISLLNSGVMSEEELSKFFVKEIENYEDSFLHMSCQEGLIFIMDKPAFSFENNVAHIKELLEKTRFPNYLAQIVILIASARLPEKLIEYMLTIPQDDSAHPQQAEINSILDHTPKVSILEALIDQGKLPNDSFDKIVGNLHTISSNSLVTLINFENIEPESIREDIIYELHRRDKLTALMWKPSADKVDGLKRAVREILKREYDDRVFMFSVRDLIELLDKGYLPDR